jgi:hypothetical protein
VFSEDIYALSLEDGETIGKITFNTLSWFGQPDDEYELGVSSRQSILFFCMKNKIFAYKKP